MFKYLQNKFNKLFFLLKNNKITYKNLFTRIKNILIESDVNFNVTKNFINSIKKKYKKKSKLIHSNELLINIIYEKLIKLMGGEKSYLNFSKKITIILIIGLQGSGKTSFSGKLAFFLKNQNKNPLLVSVDFNRPAAINQLKLIGKQIKIPVFFLKKKKDPFFILKKSLKFCKKKKHDILIIDTAGSLSINQTMMNEIKNIYNFINPTETLFVIDSMIGQDSINSAKYFFNYINYTGIVLTKLDSNTRGGIALTICSIINVPIKFICTGEKMEDINLFYPDRMADRILGRGDFISLIEKAEKNFDKKKTKQIYEKIKKNQFNIEDFLNQIKEIKKFGNIQDILSFIPNIENINIEKKPFQIIESIIFSMTPNERKNPNIINISRKKRIAKGSGSSIEEVNNFLKKFSKIKDTIKIIKNFSDQNTLIQNFFKKNK
jgi:signal recognition particle subunit SRP54